MNTLVVGSSHVNSLFFSHANAGPDFGKIKFWTSSIWSILACGTKAENGLVQLREDPLELLGRLTSRAKLIPPSSEANYFSYRRDNGMANRVPLNIRNFYFWEHADSVRDYRSSNTPDFRAFAGEAVDLVIAIFYWTPWTNPNWVKHFETFDPACPISVRAANNIKGLGGSQIPAPPLNWGPHVFGGEAVETIHEKFSLLEALEQIRELYPKARKVVCIQPPPFAPERPGNSAPAIDAFRRSIDVYTQVLCNLYRILDFETFFAPIECLDETSMYTRLEFSINPEKRDNHMNSEYGKLLWRNLRARIFDR